MNIRIVALAMSMGLYGCSAMRTGFGILTPYADLDEARRAHQFFKEFSKKGEEALVWWRKYSAKEIDAIDSIASARLAYDRAPMHSPERQKAYLKWRELLLPEFRKIEDYESAERVYNMTLSGSPEEELARQLMEFFGKALEI